MFKTLFPPRIPQATIAGLSLTKQQATELHSTTHMLITLVYQQFHAISAFDRFTRHGLSPHLHQVQLRQARFQSRLSELIKATTQDAAQPWLRELMDGQVAILRKIRQCNAVARDTLGWKDSARMYWPLIGESYENVRPVLERLEQELGDALADEEVWAPKMRARAGSKVLARRQSMVGWLAQTRRLAIGAGPRKTVAFDGEVKARWLDAEAEPEKIGGAKELRMQLATDKKNTAKLKKFKARRTSLQPVKKGGESEEEEELESQLEIRERGMQEEEEEDEDAITPIPY